VNQADPSIKQVYKIDWIVRYHRGNLTQYLNSDEETYYMFTYHIGMSVEGAEIGFYVSRDGKKLGRGEINVEYTQDDPTVFPAAQ
jgi:hypothetical protein